MLIHDDFLLENKSAVKLYHEYAAPQPIFDYHCHLPVRDIQENRQFKNLYQIWLEGDHYKWRAMRANGEPERFCHGDAEPYEKFLAWARTVPYTLRNPLYHWTHLELDRYFGISESLDADSAPRIWAKANEVLQYIDVHKILRRFAVNTVCTTDDPTDSLQPHAQIAASRVSTRVLPTFRPDMALRVDSPLVFNPWVDRLSTAAQKPVSSFPSFLDALEQRLRDFHAIGCRISDHGLDICCSDLCPSAQVAAIFDQVRSGSAATEQDRVKFASYILYFLGQLYSEAGWTMQLHLGALRNVNSRARSIHGPDTGFDTMGGTLQLNALAKFLDRLDEVHALPKTIVYNSNPIENYAFATLTGSFAGEGSPGKIQFGSAWWFMDQKEGIEWQLNALSNVGLLSRFVGMVTDSRSFMSYPRHEYFRRVLCNMLGSEMERGLIPNDEAMIGRMVRNICFHNADRYFGLPAVPSVPAAVPRRNVKVSKG